MVEIFGCECVSLIGGLIRNFFPARLIDDVFEFNDEVLAGFFWSIPSRLVGSFLINEVLSLVTKGLEIVKRSGGWEFCCWSFSTFS